MPRFYSGAACDIPETDEIPTLPPIPEFVCQQPTETFTGQADINNTNNDSTSKTTVASQMSTPKRIPPQNYMVATEYPPGNQTGKEPVSFLKLLHRYPKFRKACNEYP